MADSVIRRIIRAVFDRESAQQVEHQMEAALGNAGKRGSESFLKELRETFARRTADLKVQLAKGIISPAEFRKQSTLAAKEFNAGLVRGIEDARRAGSLTEREYLKLARQFKHVGHEGVSAFERIRGAITAAGVALVSFFAVDRIVGWGRAAVREAMEARHAMAQLRAAVESTGGASGLTVRQLERLAEGLERVSLFSKEAVQGGLTRLLTYTAIQGDMFERAAQAALDMAQRLGIDVASAAEKVGNALNYPTKALNSLTRQGFRFTEEQQRQIKALEASGRIAEAQAIIIGELELAYGGAAKAAADTVGPWRRFGLVVDDLRESLGETILRVTEQADVAEKATRVVQALTRNVRLLVDTVVSLGQALLVAGVGAGLARFLTAIRNADLALKGFRATLLTLNLAMGPKGWFTLAVVGLTVAFNALKASSRAAAEQAARSLEAFRGALGQMNTKALETQRSALDANIAQLTLLRDQLQREVEEIVPRFGRSGLPIAETPAEKLLRERLKKAKASLEQLQSQRAAVEEELRGRVAIPAEGEGAGAGGGTEDKAADRQRERFEERRAELQQEIADLAAMRAARQESAEAAAAEAIAQDRERERREAIRDLTAAQATEIERLLAQKHAETDASRAQVEALDQERAGVEAMLEQRRRAADQAFVERQHQQDVLATIQAETDLIRRRQQAEREGLQAVAALNRELFITNALLEAGATAGTAFGDAVAAAAGAQWDAANQFSTPWIDALGMIREEVEGQGSLFADLGRAWAEGGFAGIAALAKAKVKENIAAAIENAAKALGSLGLGNPLAAGKYAAAASKHTAAAAAWGTVASTAKSSGAAAGAGGGISNPTAGSTVEPPGPEVHIHLNGPGFDALNPQVQKVVHGAMTQARERYGENAIVRVHRGGRN